MPKISLIVVLTGASLFLGGLVSWQALGWPRPLMTVDLTPIEKELKATRSVADDASSMAGSAHTIATSAHALAESNALRILQNDWWRYERDIEDITQAIDERPAERRLRDSLRRLRREQADIQHEIDTLKRH